MVSLRTTKVFGCILLMAAFGCGSDPRTVTGPQTLERDAADLRSANPSSNGARSFYPLEIGNRWSYRGMSWGYYGPPGGEATAEKSNFSRNTVLVGTGVLLGKEFTGEERIREGSQTSSTVRWLRQDPTGLYQYEEPFTAFPPPLPPIEVRLLAYPLHRGATWVANEVRHAIATVEAREVIDTPAGRFPAWRIRIDYPLPGKTREQEIAWYGDVGYLGGTYDYRSEPSWNGSIFVLHEEEWLESVTLVSASRTSSRSSVRPGSRR